MLSQGKRKSWKEFTAMIMWNVFLFYIFPNIILKSIWPYITWTHDAKVLYLV